MTSKIKGEVEGFFKAYPPKRFDKGYLLIYAGYEPPGIFYLVSGQVRQYDISETGDEVVVNVFKPGAFFPMSWAINKTPNQYFFEAATTITVRQAPAEAAVDFLKSNPGVMFDLLSRVYSGTDGLLRRSAHLMGGNAKTRLLFELLLAGQRFGRRQTDGSYLIAINETELAKRAGLSRETVSRQMGKFKEQGLVSVGGRGITVKKFKTLEKTLGASL
jgi:CRP/FNR family transcriptional regulator